MQKLIYPIIFVLAISTIWLYKSLETTNQALETTQEKLVLVQNKFDSYKADIDKQIVQLQEYDTKQNKTSVETNKKINKLEKDSKRIEPVEAKPGLVGKRITKSFNTFTQEVSEATK